MVTALRRRRRVSVLFALLLASGAVLMFALLSAGAHPAQAATHHAAHHARHATVHKASETTSETSSETTGSSESTTESSTDSEQGLPGEPAGGHQDTGPNANHDCTGNCVE
jgi:cytoskeletal protein RodZ